MPLKYGSHLLAVSAICLKEKACSVTYISKVRVLLLQTSENHSSRQHHGCFEDLVCFAGYTMPFLQKM